MARSAPPIMQRVGFTLSELLIALVILGLIATFTIPKVLQSQQDSRSKAVVKETIAAMSNAFDMYKSQNTVNANTTYTDLTPFLNYVRRDTTSLVDYEPCATTQNCSNAGYMCLRMHNGTTLLFNNFMQLNGTSATNALKFHIDPDGSALGTPGDSGKSVAVYLYANGWVRTRATIEPNTQNNISNESASSACEPSWFNWN